MKRKLSKEARIIKSLTKRPEIKTPIATDLFIPNHSGDHSAGKIKGQPLVGGTGTWTTFAKWDSDGTLTGSTCGEYLGIMYYPSPPTYSTNNVLTWHQPSSAIAYDEINSDVWNTTADLINDANTITGTGTANYIPYFTGTNTIAGESVFNYIPASNRLTVPTISISSLIFDGQTIYSSTTGTSDDTILASKGYADDLDIGIDGSGTATYIPKFSDSDTLTDSVLYEDSGLKVSSGNFEVEDGNFYVRDGNSYFYSTGQNTGLTAYAYGNGTARFALYNGRGSRGSSGSPSASQSGDVFMRIGGGGDDGTGFTYNRAQIDFQATENWNGTSNGAEISFETTPNGSTTRYSRLVIGNNGDITIGGNLTLRNDGTIAPVSMADSSAANNSIYYSTTQSKLVYKDSSGTVNNLY